MSPHSVTHKTKSKQPNSQVILPRSGSNKVPLSNLRPHQLSSPRAETNSPAEEKAGKFITSELDPPEVNTLTILQLQTRVQFLERVWKKCFESESFPSLSLLCRSSEFPSWRRAPGQVSTWSWLSRLWQSECYAILIY